MLPALQGSKIYLKLKQFGAKMSKNVEEILRGDPRESPQVKKYKNLTLDKYLTEINEHRL